VKKADKFIAKKNTISNRLDLMRKGGGLDLLRNFFPYVMKTCENALFLSKEKAL